MGGKLQMRLSLLKEVRIGQYRFHRVPVYLYDDTYNVTSYPYTRYIGRQRFAPSF